MGLPEQLALKGVYSGAPAKNKYLGLADKYGKLEFAYPVHSDKAKFEVEDAKIEGGYVNIRCCANNKYLVRKDNDDGLGRLIVAEASEVEEDISKWNCTLFKAENQGNKWHLVHAQLGLPMCVYQDQVQLSIQQGNDQVKAEFEAVNTNELVVLPKKIVLMGDNDKYLMAWNNNYHYQCFHSTDLGSDWNPLEVFPDEDGNVRIKSIHWNKFWRGWVWIRADDPQGDKLESLFKPFFGADGKIALRSLERNQFLRRYSGDGETDLLRVASYSLVKEAQFKVLEPVSRRKVKVRNFHLDDARIYGLTPIQVPKQTTDNRTDHDQTATLTFSYSVTETKTWTNSVTVGGTVEATFETGIPFIFEGKVKVSVSASYTHQWAKEESKSYTTTTSTTVTVPPRTRSVVSCIALQGKCDVPFSYTQTDFLSYSGESVTITLDDGVYKGLDAFVANFDIVEEPLPQSLKA